MPVYEKMSDLAHHLRKKIQQLQRARLLVSAVLLEELALGYGFEIASIAPGGPMDRAI